MKIKYFLFFALALILMYSNANAQATWRILGKKNGTLQSGDKVKLFCLKGNNFLKSEHRDVGVNLGWIGESAGIEAKANITFEKQGGGVIKCGDKVAIKVDGESYLKYGHRDYGVNIVWSSKPVYEWEIRSPDNKAGTPIQYVSTTKGDFTVGLVSTVENDFLVYCKREWGINLGWLKDCAGGWRIGIGNGTAHDAAGILSSDNIKKALKYGAALAPLVL